MACRSLFNKCKSLMVMTDKRPIPSDWVQPTSGTFPARQMAPPLTPPILGGSPEIVAGSTVMTTATTTTTNMHLNAEGRVGKPTKRRTRASRKGPTTLFNTDTSNFRAMVQQFTGAPSGPSASGSQTGAPIINFGLGDHGLGPYQGMTVPPSRPFPVIQQARQQQQQQQQLLALQGGGDLPVFSFGNNRPSSSMGFSDAFLESMSSYGQTSNDNNSNDNNNGLHFIGEDRFRNQY